MTTKTSNPLPPFASVYSVVKKVFLSLSVLSVLSVVQPAFAQTGNLEVDGSLKVNQGVTTLGRAELRGNDLWIGRWADNSAAGLALTYTDGAPQGKPDTNVWYNHHWSAEWSLQHGSPVGAVTSLNLSSDHQLKLFPSLWEVGVNPTIILNPNGGGSILINGKKVLTGGNGTQNPLALGSSNWGGDNIASSEFAFAVGTENVASGNGSVALGGGNIVSGFRAAALGQQNSAQGTYAFSAGNVNIASGNTSVAMGWNNRALGDRSFAVGQSSEANARSSVAIGEGNIANKDFSIALGNYTSSMGLGAISLGTYNNTDGTQSAALGYALKAKTRCQVVLGCNNIPIGDPSVIDRNMTDTLFILGNGDPSSSAQSNALTVKWNGDTTVFGNLESTKTIKSNGKEVLTQDSLAQNLRVAPQGDLSMGEFTAGGQ